MKRIFQILFLPCAALSLNSCNNDDEAIALAQKELNELSKQSKTIRAEALEERSRYSKLRSLSKSLDSNEKKLSYVNDNLEPLVEYESKLQEAIESHEHELQAWRDAHRQTLVGLKIPHLTKADGSKLPRVEILEVTDETLEIDSNGKQMTVNISELSAGAQERIVYEKSVK